VPNSFGFGSDTTGFSSTVHNAIQKAVVDTLRAGLVCLPKGAVVPAQVVSNVGNNFTLISTEYPDLVDAAATNPLTEGVAPTPVKLGISTNSWTVQQQGQWTKVTDVAEMQSPHDLKAIAADKIARLAAQTFDGIALAAFQARAVDREYRTGVLSTANILDAKGEMKQRNVSPVPGAGYYAILHPFALRGLEGESALNGYVDVTSHNAAEAGSLTAGAVSQYRGVTFLPSPRITGALCTTSQTGPTSTNGSPTLTLASHGLSNGVRIQFQTITGGGSNIVINTDYYVKNAQSGTFEIAATRGGASIVQNTANMTATTFKNEVFPVYVVGANSLTAGDISTLSFHGYSGDAPGNELGQLSAVGFKSVFGVKLLSFAETADGAGNNTAAVDRVYSFSVMSGQTA
jgi:N4-gp56 family major capsid protein